MNDQARLQSTTQPYLPPVPPANLSASQLPGDVSPFIGRSSELGKLRTMALREKIPNKSQVIVIFGKPGIGKSTLATHFAHQIKESFPDAQLYANLRIAAPSEKIPDRATNEDYAADILTGFLRALGVQGEAMPTSLSGKASLYRSILANQSALILIDGAESAEVVEPLIPASPSCLVLVTSRSRLQRLQPSRLPLEVLDMESAVQLLAARAGGDKVDKELAAAKEVVHRCGYLPLAIALVGARLATRASWSVDSLADRLRRNKSNLLDEFRSEDTAIAVSFSLSYEALAPEQQTFFRRLAVFSGPHFDDAAAACLVRQGPDNVTTMLERLADLNLLEQAEWDDCYQFHDLLREYARWHFEMDEPQEIKQQCVLAVLEHYDRRLKQADQSLQPISVASARADATDPGHDERMNALKWLTREHPNLVAAVTQAVQHGQLDLAAQLAARLASFFEVRAHYDDWLETHEFVLRHLQVPVHISGRAILTRSLGKLFYFQHIWERAVSSYREALQLFHQLGEAREVGITLLYLGDTYRYQREWDSARNTLTASLAQLRSVKFARGEAIALRSLGAVSRLTGDFSKATDIYHQALRIFEEIGDDRWIAATRLSLADIYIDDKQPAEALPLLEECLIVFEEYGDRHWRSLTLRSMGESLRQLGEYDKARICLERSLVILRKDGDRHWEAATVEDVGELHAAQGDWTEAIACYLECIEMLTAGNRDRLVEARARKNLGIALNAMGDKERAQQEWRTAWISFLEQNGQEAIEIQRLLGEEA